MSVGTSWSSRVGAQGYSASRIHLAYEPYIISADVRIGYVAANSAASKPDIDQPALTDLDYEYTASLFAVPA